MSRSHDSFALTQESSTRTFDDVEQISFLWQTGVICASQTIGLFVPHQEMILYIGDKRNEDFQQYSSINGSAQDEILHQFVQHSIQCIFKDLFSTKNPQIQSISSPQGHPILILAVKLQELCSLNVFAVLVFSPDDINFSVKLDQAPLWTEMLTLVLGNHYLKHHIRQMDVKTRLHTPIDDILATIAHEIRGPLGYIKGFTTTLLRTGIRWTQGEQRQLLSIIDLQTDHVLEILDTMIESTKKIMNTEHHQIRIEPVRLDKLIFDSVTQTRVINPNVIIDIQICPQSNLLPVYGDSGLLMRVFDNLIGNAIKYAPDSQIIIRLLQDQKTTSIIFEDFGPGIPEQYQTSLFTRFFRVPESSGLVQGSGLGLFICKQIMTAHHGNIKVVSKPGKGSQFHIIFPASISDEGVISL